MDGEGDFFERVAWGTQQREGRSATTDNAGHVARAPCGCLLWRGDSAGFVLHGERGLVDEYVVMLMRLQVHSINTTCYHNESYHRYRYLPWTNSGFGGLALVWDHSCPKGAKTHRLRTASGAANINQRCRVDNMSRLSRACASGRFIAVLLLALSLNPTGFASAARAAGLRGAPAPSQRPIPAPRIGAALSRARARKWYQVPTIACAPQSPAPRPSA